MARRQINTTKHEIIKTAMRLFLENGYSSTTPRRICSELDISTGNLTYYFPTKEHLLSVLVDILCRYQTELLQEAVKEDPEASILGVCLELATMASVSESCSVIYDMFRAAYCSPMCLEIIRKHDRERSKRIFAKYCPGWGEQEFAEAEILVSGLEYATLTVVDTGVPLDLRIKGALNQILMIYNVPEPIRYSLIQKTLETDYPSLSTRVLDRFKKFVEANSELVLEK